MTRSNLLLAGASLVALSVVLPGAMQRAAAQTSQVTASAPVKKAGDLRKSNPRRVAPVPVAAAPKMGLETVNVTAQRRTQRLQDVPVSVTAISPKSLDTFQIRSTKDVALLVPNMSGTNNPGIGTAATYFIRGLGSTGSIATFDPAVGTYVDDIYIPRQNANDFGFFDVDQIQVLRGPQGTLFGSNTTGGAVVVSLKTPAMNTQGSAELGYGSYNRVTGRGSVDVPLSATVFTKTSFFAQSDDGYARSLATNERLDATHDVGVREGVRVLLGDDVTWNFSGAWIRDDVTALPTVANGGNRYSDSGFSTSGGALEPYITGDKGRNGQGNLTQSWLTASHFTVVKDWGKFDIITGYQGVSQNYALDLFGASYPTGGYVLDNYDRSNTVSQEVKFSSHLGRRFTYTGGLYYSHEADMTDFASLSTGTAGLHPAGSLGHPTVSDDGTLNNTTESYAAYAQGDYKVTSALTATIGARYTIQSKKFDYNSNNNPLLGKNAITMNEIIGAGISDSEKTTLPSFHGALSYRINTNLMAYVSGTEGFKSGGWNAFGSTPASFTRFGPEKDWTVEAGLRSNFWNDRGRFNLTAFWMYDSGFQTTADTVLSNGSASFLTGNFSDMENYGLEADGAVQLFHDFTIEGNAGLQKAWYTNLSPNITSQLAMCRSGVASSCGSSIITPGGSVAEPQFTPAFTTTIGYNWKFWHNDRLSLTNNADVNMVSRELVALAGVPSGIDKFRAVMDFGVTLAPTRAKWTITAECKNCTFVTYSTYGLGSVRYLNAPGYWDVRLAYRF